MAKPSDEMDAAMTKVLADLMQESLDAHTEINQFSVTTVPDSDAVEVKHIEGYKAIVFSDDSTKHAILLSDEAFAKLLNQLSSLE